MLMKVTMMVVRMKDSQYGEDSCSGDDAGNAMARGWLQPLPHAKVPERVSRPASKASLDWEATNGEGLARRL